MILSAFIRVNTACFKHLIEDGMEILRLEDISKVYSLEGEQIKALRDVNFHLDAGDITVILGPSGSGKSTLLSLLGGLSSPSKGEVFCKNRSLYKMSIADLAKFRNKVFGFVFQFHHLMPELTALENVILPSWIGLLWALRWLSSRPVSLPMALKRRRTWAQR